MAEVDVELISINIHKTNKVFETLGEKILPYYICTNLWVTLEEKWNFLL